MERYHAFLPLRDDFLNFAGGDELGKQVGGGGWSLKSEVTTSRSPMINSTGEQERLQATERRRDASPARVDSGETKRRGGAWKKEVSKERRREPKPWQENALRISEFSSRSLVEIR